MGTNKTVEVKWRPSMHANMRRVRSKFKEEREREREREREGGGGECFCLESDDFGFICAGVSNLGDYKRNA